MHELIIDNRGALVLKILIDLFFTWARFFILFFIFSKKKKKKSIPQKRRKEKKDYDEN